MLDTLVNIIESERQKKGITKGFLCQQAGIKSSQYSRLLKGENSTFPIIEKLLIAVGVKKINIKL